MLVYFSGVISAQEWTGNVFGVGGRAVEFATIVLLKDNKQVAVAVTDTLGRFNLSVAEGEYIMKIQNIAYKPWEQTIEILPQKTELGVFELEESVFGLNEAMVTSSLITRYADRFIMRVADTPMMLNKDATEVLQLAPGVWVDANGIFINGTGGTNVFINERELKLSPKELAAYLRNFQSSDIAQVEVIPQAGAEYSADSRGGVIKIVLRKQLENGVSGNVLLLTSHGKHIEAYRPSATVNANVEKWTLNAFVTNYLTVKSKNELIATRDFYDNPDDSYFRSESHLNGKPRLATGRIGAIFDLNSHSSFGAEIEYSFYNYQTPSYAETTVRENNITVNSTSDYRQKETDQHFSATFNYVHKIDTIGSTFKWIADYTNKDVRGNNDYHSVFEWENGSTDSIYRNNSTSDYRIFSSDIVFNKQFRNKTKFSVGAKYTRNNMSDEVFYESLYQTAWKPLQEYNFALDYTENIGAIYGTFGTNINQWSLSAGLRGEYTQTQGRGNDVLQHYLDLFPSANLTYSFDAMRLFMLIGQYSRSIQRPNFWYLNPNRIQYSEYSYMIGNPNLHSTYINRFSLTAVYNYRYVLSVGGNLHRDLIREVNRTDPINQRVTYITPENHHMENHYFVALSFPLKLTEWCNLNTNLVGVKQDIRGTENAKNMSHYLYFANAIANFTLLKDFYLEVSYSGTSRLYSANSGINPRQLFHASLKKQLFDKRLTASLGINNMFNSKSSYFSDTERFRINSDGYEASNSRFVRFSIQYNFKAGKSFKDRKIESALNEGKSRLEKSSEAK
jgi:hypothetical protein